MFKKPPSNLQLAAHQYWCGWCAESRSHRFFDLHGKACKWKHTSIPSDVSDADSSGIHFLEFFSLILRDAKSSIDDDEEQSRLWNLPSGFIYQERSSNYP